MQRQITGKWYKIAYSYSYNGWTIESRIWSIERRRRRDGAIFNDLKPSFKESKSRYDTGYHKLLQIGP